MAALARIAKELTRIRRVCGQQGLAEPSEAKVVHREKNGMPVTDGIFPESKEFCWATGSWT